MYIFGVSPVAVTRKFQPSHSNEVFYSRQVSTEFSVCNYFVSDSCSNLVCLCAISLRVGLVV